MGTAVFNRGKFDKLGGLRDLSSVNAAYQAKAEGIGVTIESVYNKLNAIELQMIVEALVRLGACEQAVETGDVEFVVERFLSLPHMA